MIVTHQACQVAQQQAIWQVQDLLHKYLALAGKRCNDCLRENQMCVYLALPGNAGGVAADGFSNAKINELELPLNHEKVGRLEI